MHASPRLAFVASKSPEVQAQLAELTQRYGQCAPSESDVIVAIGGDGFMLQTLHRNLALGKPVYGINAGSVGFLMNQLRTDDLPERIAAAEATRIKPLEMLAITDAGSSISAFAFNEVSLLRQTKQAAKIRISVNDQIRLDELICDGILVATPAGSTAYNLSAHGPILPLGSEMLAMTPICAFRPRRWRGAILASGTQVRFEILEPYKRPVSATADTFEVRDVAEVLIREAPDKAMTLLFDPGHSMEQRILDEQFTV